MNSVSNSLIVQNTPCSHQQNHIHVLCVCVCAHVIMNVQCCVQIPILHAKCMPVQLWICMFVLPYTASSQ